LARLAADRGDFARAESELVEYLRSRPGDKRARLELAKARARKGDWELSKATLVELERDFPDDPSVQLELTAAYRALGEKEKSVNAAERLVTLRGEAASADDPDAILAGLDVLEGAVKNYSSGVRDSWDKNLRVLREALAHEAADVPASAGSETGGEEDPDSFLGLSGAVARSIPVDEEAEILFLDEREEELLEEPLDEVSEPDFEEEEEEEPRRDFDGIVEESDRREGASGEGRGPAEAESPRYDESSRPQQQAPQSQQQAPQPQQQAPQSPQQQAPQSPQYQPHVAPLPQTPSVQMPPIQMPPIQMPPVQMMPPHMPPLQMPSMQVPPEHVEESGRASSMPQEPEEGPEPESDTTSHGEGETEAGEDEGDAIANDLPEYIEDLPFEDSEEEEEEDDTLIDEMGDLAALPEETPALSLEEEAEDIWDEAPPELSEESEPPAAQGVSSAPEVPPAEAPCGEGAVGAGNSASAAESPSPGGGEPLLGEPTARLLEYLKGLLGDLSEDKREEFETSGLKERMEGLIERLKSGPESHTGVVPPPVGLLASGEAKRRSDPRRSPDGRRSGQERRTESDRRDGPDRRSWVERRFVEERRAGCDRREGDRRVPPPALDLPATIPPEAVPVKMSPDGTPTEIAGISVSPRLARLIEIMRREKDNGRS
jgi:tetratricopeptide (TPR) repeat protein